MAVLRIEGEEFATELKSVRAAIEVADEYGIEEFTFHREPNYAGQVPTSERMRRFANKVFEYRKINGQWFTKRGLSGEFTLPAFK